MWIDVLEGKYQVSTEGEIRNAKTGRILKQYIGKDGYKRIQIAGLTRLVHRVVLFAYYEQPEGKPFVNHKDGNKQNNSLNNLEWCDRSENMKHAYCNKLKSSVGSKNGRHKLTESDVDYIRKNYVKGSKEHGCFALAKRFNVAHQTISAVITEQNWKG